MAQNLNSVGQHGLAGLFKLLTKLSESEISSIAYRKIA